MSWSRPVNTGDALGSPSSAVTAGCGRHHIPVVRPLQYPARTRWDYSGGRLSARS